MDDRLPLLLAAAAGAGVWHACTTLRCAADKGDTSSAGAATPPAAAVPTGAGAGTVMGTHAAHSIECLSCLLISFAIKLCVLF
jgi:hypothetical protein